MRIYKMYMLVWKGQMAFEFYWISFCINFHRFFFIFHFVLLLLSSFMDSLLFFSFSLSLPLSFIFPISFRSTFCPLVLGVVVQYARLYRIIYESPLEYKLFTSYTTKYRHRYIDSTWMWWWWLFVRSLFVPFVRVSLSNFFWFSELDWSLVWFRFDTDLWKYINCTTLLNIRTYLYRRWICTQNYTFIEFCQTHSYGTISQILVNICCLFSGSQSLYLDSLTFIFNGHRQSYKIHFQLVSLHCMCVCLCVTIAIAVVLYWIDIL